MLLCFAEPILSAALTAQPLLGVTSNNCGNCVFTATVVWSVLPPTSTGSLLVTEVEDTEDSKPKDGRR